MNTEKIKNFLISKGFIEYKDSLNPDTICLARREQGEYLCECNDRYPQVLVKIHDFTISDHHCTSVDFSIIGEFHNQWVDLQIYGVSFEKAEKNLDKIVHRLKKMWETYCQETL